MTIYIQYDEIGNITATVKSIGIPSPIYERQLSFEEEIDITGKMVDMGNQVLIDILPQ